MTSWIDSLRARWWPGLRTRRGHRRSVSTGLEALEDRTLLSVTSLFFNGALTLISDANDTIVIREDLINAGRVEVLTGVPVGGSVTLAPDTSIGALDANQVQTIIVRGGDGPNDIDLGNRLGLGGVEMLVFTSLTSVDIDGANGDDLITGTIDFDDTIAGGHGADVITVGTGDVVVDGGDGDDDITGGPGNDSLSGGDGDDTIRGADGVDTIDAGDGHDLVFGGDEISPAGDSITSGHGDDTVFGGEGDDWINGRSGHDQLTGDDGNDTIHGGAGRDTILGNDGNDTLNGHGGHDVIFGGNGDDLANGHWGHDYIDGDDADPTSLGGNDTLLGGSGRDTLFGNLGDDNLKGQGGHDTLLGGHGVDKLNGGGGNDLLRGFYEQIVFLDFDSQTDRRSEHVYTDVERNAIEARLASDLAAFDVHFQQTAPVASELFLQNGTFATVVFNDAPTGTGISLGQAGEANEYDFRNLSLGGVARVDVTGPGGLLGGAGQPAETSNNIIAASAWVAAHELGHLLGLRHVDAFGPLSATVGITIPPGPASFSPAFPGPTNATETGDHVMVAPSLLGPGQVDATADPFFGERSAIKLAFNESGLVVQEQATAHGGLNTGSAQAVSLRSLGVPNTLESGVNSESRLNVEAAAVIGATIGVGGEVDVYSFEGTGGQVVSIEILSEWLTRISDPIDTIVRVYDSTGTVLPYFSSDTSATDVAVNDGFDDGSGVATGDPVLLNLTLPVTGNLTDTYFIQVAEPTDRGLFAVPTDGSNQFVELDPLTGVELNRVSLPVGETSSGRAALSYDAANDVLYFINGNTDILYELDPDNGAVIDSTVIVSPNSFSPGDYDGLAVIGGEVFILDVTAETIPGNPADQNADPQIPEVFDPPEILVFDPASNTVTRTLNLVGTGQGPEPAGANLAGTFGDITGGLAAIDPNGTPALLLLDQRGTLVHEINPGPGAGGGVSTTNYAPIGVNAGTYDAVGGFLGQVFLGTGSGGGNQVDVLVRGDGTVVQTLSLTPNAPPSYNLTALGADDNVAAPSATGSYELFITKVDLTPGLASTAVGDTLIGGTGNDSLFGSSSNDLLKGQGGRDQLHGLGGNDLLNGGSDNDTLNGGLDDDVLLGGSGLDKLRGDAGDDVLDGQGGADTLDGGAGHDTLQWRAGGGSDTMNNSADSAIVIASGRDIADNLSIGKTAGNRPRLTISDGVSTIRIASTIWRVDVNAGNGDDTLSVVDLDDVAGTLVALSGENGNDTLTAAGARFGDVRLRMAGGDGDDVLTGGRSDDTLWGGDGQDRIDGGQGADIIAGDAGDDTLNGQDGQDTLTGGPGNDTLDGGNGHDSLDGGDGFDTLDGGLGRDTLLGGDGEDRLSGQQGDDNLDGGSGSDSLFGGTGNDYLLGGLNDDSLYGNYGNDTIGGGDGNDLLDGSQGFDILNGGDGDDVLRGGADADGLSGGDGHDVMNGGGDDDTVIGGDGDDSMYGGGGRDILLGGNGNDSLNGQGGIDSLAGNEGVDDLVGSPDEIDEGFSFYASWIESV